MLAWITVVRTVMDMIVHHPSLPARTEELISWKPPPPPEWVTVNSDSSVHHESGSVATGGLIRDHLGHCIAAFTLNLRICLITRAELRGIVEGL
ncbi:unnamed protein product [Linum trigynum]|uniref:RNase H type-1 domain-containing protein n=1 Tax=Linum trigynum TaxID=586398 RepID=A0AAV2DT33_9ROSI